MLLPRSEPSQTFGLNSGPNTIDSLALAAAYFKVPKVTHLKYPINVRYRPSIPDDIKHWKVFHDDQEIK